MFNFKKIASVLASAIMLSSTIGFAAAAYPEPFVTSGTENVAIVYGAAAATSDLVGAIDLQANLQALVSTGTSTTGSSVSGGDSTPFLKSSDNLNLGDGTKDLLPGSVTDSHLPVLLADGTYVTSDNDEFKFEQKITVGNFTLSHFQESDYETLVGLTAKTPTIGFKLESGTHVLNYTLDFVQDAASRVTSGDLNDIEGSDITLLGRTYYVSDLANGTTQGQTGKMVLLDSAVIGSVAEGETTTVSVEGTAYSVTITYIDSDEVVFDINGQRAPETGKLKQGDPYKLDDGSYIGVRDISKLEVSGEIGSASFSVGSGKLELTHGSDVKFNDLNIPNLRAFLEKGSYSSPDEKLSKITIEWSTENDEFLTPLSELVMPGFRSVKLSMGGLTRPTEEKVSIDTDGDTSIELKVPIKDGLAAINILFANASGEFIGIGKAHNDRLATINGSGRTIVYYERNESGKAHHKGFVATYATGTEAESYYLRAKVRNDTSDKRKEVDIENILTGQLVCDSKIAGETCDIGNAQITISVIGFKQKNKEENVSIIAGSNVNFDTIYTTGGLRIYLPFIGSNMTTALGGINFSGDQNANTSNVGHTYDTWYLSMHGEDKDDNIASGTGFTFTVNDNSDGDLQIQNIVTTAANTAGSGTGGGTGLEQGDTNVFEAYVLDDVAPRILHYTQPDEDTAEVYYPTGNSETSADLFIADVASVITPGSSTTGGGGGQVLVVKDSEVGSVASKNLVVVGGSCINTVAASILGSVSPLCTSDFTDATGVGAGQYIIKTVTSPLNDATVAMLVAGYDAADTTSAVAKALEGGLVTDAGTETVYPIVGA